ncbi:MAG: hypothetical protein LBK95_20510 [Bifidobacteriaceae bacterium]|nr:hypothetical protein [Bifidobacteriaceae bacterium]
MTRWALGLGVFTVLAGIAAVAVAYQERAQFARWWAMVIGAGLVAVIAWRLAGKTVLRVWHAWRLPRWVLPVALFVAMAAVKAFFAFRWPTEQRSDFLSLLEAAQSINLGDYSFSQDAYWHYFAYQTPFAIYEAFMLKVFAGSIVPLLAVNALVMAGTNLLVFLFARRIAGSTAAGLFAAFAYLAYPGPYLEANVLSNDHLSAFFLLLGAYVVLAAARRLERAAERRAEDATELEARGRSGRLRSVTGGVAAVLAGGVFLALGNLARPAGMVVCAALVAALVLGPLTRRGRGRSWWPLGASAALAVLVLAVYALTGAAASGAIKASGINPAGSANGLPEWKFVLGTMSSGTLHTVGERIGISDPVPNPDSPEIARAMLKENLRQLPSTWREVVWRQAQSLWGSPDTASFMFWPQLGGAPYHEVPNGKQFPAAHGLVLLERGLFLPAVLMAALGAAMISRQRRWGAAATFLGCLVAAYALVHLAIEVQPRYRYLAMPAIFALTGPAWSWLAGCRRRSDRAEVDAGSGRAASSKAGAGRG